MDSQRAARMIGLLVVGDLILARRQLGAPSGFDETYFVWEGWAVNHHLVPYRDFMEFKPPVVFWMNGLALRLFGASGFGFRWLFILSLVLATVLLFIVLCRRGSDRALAFLAAAAVPTRRWLRTSTIPDSTTRRRAGCCFSFMERRHFSGTARSETSRLCWAAPCSRWRCSQRSRSHSRSWQRGPRWGSWREMGVRCRGGVTRR